MKANVFNKAVMSAIAAATLAGGVLAVTPVCADNNGVQNPVPNGDTYDSANGGKWSKNGGKVDLTYDTTGGGFETDVPGDGTMHPNGTYCVYIPAGISYTGMKVGAVNVSNTYDVKVIGVLSSGKAVKLTATTGQVLTGSKLTGSITETTTMEDEKTSNTKSVAYDASTSKKFRTFTAAQAAAASTTDNTKIGGTTVTDKISLNGDVRSAGTYKAAVTYTATLVNE